MARLFAAVHEVSGVVYGVGAGGNENGPGHARADAFARNPRLILECDRVVTRPISIEQCRRIVDGETRWEEAQ